MQPYTGEWRERGFDVIFVTTVSRENMMRFIADAEVEMEAYGDPEAAMHEAYSVRALPTSFVLDDGGRIREMTLGWGPDSLEEMESWVEELAPGG